MIRHYIFLGALTLAMLIAVVYGFYISGSPFTARALKFDATRLNDFRQLKYAIESNVSSKGALPLSLDELSQGYVSISKKDPESGFPYEYQPVSGDSYKLCAVFSTDSRDTPANQTISPAYYNDQTTIDHRKGHDCVTYSVTLPNLAPVLNPFNNLPAFTPKSK